MWEQKTWFYQVTSATMGTFSVLLHMTIFYFYFYILLFMRTCASMLLLSSWSVNVLWITRATMLPAVASKMHHNYLCCLSGFGRTMRNGTMALSRSQLNCTIPDAPGIHISSFISHFLMLSATSVLHSLVTCCLHCSFFPLQSRMELAHSQNTLYCSSLPLC